VYIVVLSLGMLLTVIGLALVASGRRATRTAALLGDADEAAVLAESGVEWGIAALAANTNWRSAYTHNVEVAARTLGRGTVAFKLVSVSGTSLSSGDVRLVGIGRVGTAYRAYAVRLSGTGATLDVLKTTAHSGGNVSVTANLTLSGGALSSNGNVTLGSNVTVTGAIEAINPGTTGTVTGGRTTLASARTMPGDTLETYRTRATTITYASLPSGQINARVLSSASNPFGATNAEGIYYIRVPASSTLTITRSRLVATLVVELDPGARVVTSAQFAWDSPRTDMPALIVKGSSTGTVTLGGSTTALSELNNATNYNPPGTPNDAGVSDNDTSDTYPTEFHGLLHVIGSGLTTQMSTNFVMRGSAIVEGPLSIGSGVKLTADPALYNNPPSGYMQAANMSVTPGSWTWEAASQ
jgi:hypothetical protein